MSRYPSKNELVSVIKRTIETDYNTTGLPTNLDAYNFAGILRTLGVTGDHYGWTYDYTGDFATVLRTNLRPAYKRSHYTGIAIRRERGIDDAYVRTYRGVCTCGWESIASSDSPAGQARTAKVAAKHAANPARKVA